MDQTARLNTQSFLFTLVVCTHNRAEWLVHCLQSVADAAPPSKPFEVLVVNNNSSDDTTDLVAVFAGKVAFPLRLVNEPAIGLSHARNRGAAEAKSDWLVYVDDDAKIWPDYLQRVEMHILNNQFQAFGGMYHAWYPQGKPSWMPEQFGTRRHVGTGVVRLQPGSSCSGGNFAIRKAALQQVGGFPTHLGMAGDTIAYGEENYVQDKMMAMGLPIGFDNDLAIDHLVADYKTKLRWHFQKEIAHGRSETMLGKWNQSPGKTWLKALEWSLKRTGQTLALGLKQPKSFHWKRALLYTASPLLVAFGQTRPLAKKKA